MPGSWGLNRECSEAVSKWTDQLGWKHCSRCIFMQHDTSFLGGTAHDKLLEGYNSAMWGPLLSRACNMPVSSNSQP